MLILITITFCASLCAVCFAVYAPTTRLLLSWFLCACVWFILGFTEINVQRAMEKIDQNESRISALEAKCK